MVDDNAFGVLVGGISGGARGVEEPQPRLAVVNHGTLCRWWKVFNTGDGSHNEVMEHRDTEKPKIKPNNFI